MRTLNQADLPYRPQLGPHVTSCTARSFYTPEPNPLGMIVIAVMLLFLFCIAFLLCLPTLDWLFRVCNLKTLHQTSRTSDWLSFFAAFGMTVSLANYLNRFRAKLHESVPMELFEGGIHLTTKVRFKNSGTGSLAKLETAERWVTRSWRLIQKVSLVESDRALGNYLELQFTDGERIEIHQNDGEGCDTAIDLLVRNFNATSKQTLDLVTR